MFTRLAGNDTIPWTSGAYTSIAWSEPMDSAHDHFLTDSCMRYPNSPFYLRTWTWYTLFFLVPLYTLASAFRNLQPLTTKRKDLKQILAMVIISSVSFAGQSLTFAMLCYTMLMLCYTDIYLIQLTESHQATLLGVIR